jgi:hypothetical protein
MSISLPTSSAIKQVITVASLMDQLPIESKLLVQNVLDYANDMAPTKRVTEAIGVRHQTKLYNTLINLVNQIEESHNLAYAATFLIIEENRQKAFHEFNAFRYGDSTSFLTKEKRKVFRSLLHLFITVGPRDTRVMMLRQIDIDKVLSDNLIQANGRDRMKNFLEQFKK